MLSRHTFYTEIRQTLLHVLTQQQVNGIEAIFDYWELTLPIVDWLPHPEPPLSWLAYILATAYHETAHTFRDDIREAEWLSEEWRKTHLRYYPYYGRGLPQLTWEHNYDVWQRLTRVQLVGTPDNALGKISINILIRGMIEGRFTGHRLSDYTDEHGGVAFDFARRIVNDLDQAELIAGYAQKFWQALLAAEIAEPNQNEDAIYKGNVTLEPPNRA